MAFDPLKDISNLEGKVILVTGGECFPSNTGLGAATIKFLVRRNPSCIYLCARPVSVPQGEALVTQIRSWAPDTNIQLRTLDLSSLASVKKFCADFLREAERLDLLFLNAGISTTAPALTEDGYESQFGVNHVGHALLTQLLMPKFLETAARNSDVQVLVTTSLAAHVAPPAHSKLANILFARKLAQLYPSIRCVSFNPGQVKTDLFKKASGINWWFLMTVGMLFMHLTGVSAEKGAENGLWAASSKDLQAGAFYEPVGILEDQKKFLTDQVLADELWDWTNKEFERHGAPGWPKA